MNSLSALLRRALSSNAASKYDRRHVHVQVLGQNHLATSAVNPTDMITVFYNIRNYRTPALLCKSHSSRLLSPR